MYLYCSSVNVTSVLMREKKEEKEKGERGKKSCLFACESSSRSPDYSFVIICKSSVMKVVVIP